MGCNNEIKDVIPTIDFSKPDLQPGTSQWESTKTQVFKALQEYGCFEAIYDKVSREAIFDTSKEIFSSIPVETKLKSRSTLPMHGYLGQFPMLPFYESLGISDVFNPQSVESIANILWPDGNLNLSNVLQIYSKPIVELGELIKKMVLESLGLQKYMQEFLDSYYYNLRLTHYKAAPLGKDGNKLGLSVHTDYGLLTLISQNSVNGLEVLPKNGEWIDVKLAPNSLLVISGDSFMAWTNGTLHSPMHRVTLTENSERFSIPLFSVPKSGYTVEAPKELVDDEHPLLFKPFKFLDFYAYAISEPGIKAGSGAFKAFCGV